jgi:VanZ family protein
MQFLPGRRSSKAAALIIPLRDRARPMWPWFAVLWLVAFVTLFFLYVLPATAPPTAIFGIELHLDKLFHALAHGSLVAVPLAIVPNRRLAAVMAVLAVAAGVLFECAQLYVPERSFGFDDMAANMAGAIIGGLLGWKIRRL